MITNVILTAYCACTLCCGPKAPRPTASGRWPVAGVTIAAPRSVPVGTWVTVKGVGRRRVDDRTRADIDGWDVFIPDHAQAKRFGKRKARITYD